MRLFTSILLTATLVSCTHVRHLDAEVYGSPPKPLTQDVTVVASFKDAFSVSMDCGRKAMGAIGTLVPSHGCVHARIGEPVEMIVVGHGDLLGTTRVVEFVAPEKAADVCARLADLSGNIKGLPEGGCIYGVANEDHKRIVWPNPCDTGDAYMCHELGHVNQFALGWQRPSFSPAYHWGRPPEEPRFVVAGTQPSEADDTKRSAEDSTELQLASVETTGSMSNHYVPASGTLLTGISGHRSFAPVPDALVAP